MGSSTPYLEPSHWGRLSLPQIQEENAMTQWAIHQLPDLHDEPSMVQHYLQAIDEACIGVPHERPIRAAIMARIKGKAMQECFWSSKGDIEQFREMVSAMFLKTAEAFADLKSGARYECYSHDSEVVAATRRDFTIFPMLGQYIMTGARNRLAPDVIQGHGLEPWSCVDAEDFISSLESSLRSVPPGE